MLNPIVTAYVQDYDGNMFEVALYDGECTIEEHIDFVIEHMMTDDEIINIVFH